MCYDQGHVQSYIDDELSREEMEETREHLVECGDCQRLYQNLLETDELVRSSMQGLLMADRERFNAELSWQQLKLAATQGEHKRKGVASLIMRYKKFLAASAAALALVGMFSFSPVRTMAGDFLTIFRVDKVRPIVINPEEMSQLERLMENGAGSAEINNFGKVVVTGKQEAVAVTRQEAQNAVDFKLRLPDIVDSYGEPELKKIPAGSVTLALDVNNVNAVLQSLGSGERLPDELNGKEFTLVTPPAITAAYNSPAGKLFLFQGRGPYLQTSAGVDVKSIRQALLSIPGLPQNLKQQLAAVEDWQHTALIPVMSGQYAEVSVNGAEGVFIKGNAPSRGQPMNALVWQADGVICGLAGEGLQEDKALGIAGTMK